MTDVKSKLGTVRSAFRGAKDALQKADRLKLPETPPDDMKWGLLDPRHPEHVPPSQEYVKPPKPRYTLDDTTHHPKYGSLNLLQHGPLSISQDDLEQPDHYGINGFAGSVADGDKKVFVKGLGTHQGDEWKEGVIQHIADAMDVSHMVPRTSIHQVRTENYGPMSFMVQEHVDGHQHGNGQNIHPDRAIGMRLSASRGDLARAAMLNYLTANADRHRNNFKAHPTEGVKLYDHGLTFYGGSRVEPAYLKDAAVSDTPIGISLGQYLDSVDHEAIGKTLDKVKFSRLAWDDRLTKLKNELKYWGDDGTMTHGQLHARLRML